MHIDFLNTILLPRNGSLLSVIFILILDIFQWFLWRIISCIMLHWDWLLTLHLISLYLLSSPSLSLFASCHISSLLPAIILDNSCLLSPIGANLLEKKNFSWNFCLLLDSWHHGWHTEHMEWPNSISCANINIRFCVNLHAVILSYFLI